MDYSMCGEGIVAHGKLGANFSIISARMMSDVAQVIVLAHN